MVFPSGRLIPDAENRPGSYRDIPGKMSVRTDAVRQVHHVIKPDNVVFRGRFPILFPGIHLGITRLCPPPFDVVRMTGQVTGRRGKSQDDDIMVISCKFLPGNVVTAVLDRIALHVTFESYARDWLGKDSVEAGRSIHPGFRPDHFLHGVLRSNPGTAGYRPSGPIHHAHLQAVFSGFFLQETIISPPCVTEISVSTGRRTFGGVEKIESTQSDLMHRGKVFPDGVLSDVSVLPMIPCQRFVCLRRCPEAFFRPLRKRRRSAEDGKKQ